MLLLPGGYPKNKKATVLRENFEFKKVTENEKYSPGSFF